MSMTVNLHVDASTPINVTRYPEGAPGEAYDRITFAIGPVLGDVTMFLDRDAVARLLTQLTEERDWFSQQAADRIHATLTAAECGGPVCELHGIGITSCPVCCGPVEPTPSGAVTCREHGSSHYRVEPNKTSVGADGVVAGVSS